MVIKNLFHKNSNSFLLIKTKIREREQLAMENEEFLHRHKVIRYFRKSFLQIAKTVFFRISSVQQGFNEITVPIRFLSNSQCIGIFLSSSFIKVFASFNFGHFYRLIDFSTMLSNYCQIYFL